ncbi:MAG TPA: hypothetical protein PLM29_14755 [Deltaproteobacteria bacterium]|nr:hypothetical protein [Deltaproteobacteria bacterium]
MTSIRGLIIILLLLPVHAFAQEKTPESRQAFIRSTINTLKAFQPDAATDTARHTILGSGKHRFFIKENGLIRLPSGEWIYFMSNSQHDQNQFGDLLLAKDSHGRLFYSEAHVCGGILITLAEGRKPSSVEDILHAEINEVNGLLPLNKRALLSSPRREAH